MFTPLLKPSEYFAERDDPFTGGFAVVILNVLVSAVAFYIFFQELMSSIGNSVETAQIPTGSILVVAMTSIVVGTAIGWFLVGAILHIPYSDSGSYEDALGVAGWWYAPSIAVTPVTFGFEWYRLQSLNLDSSDPAVIQQELEAAQNLGNYPLGIVILLITTVWGMYILTNGLAETYDVPTSKTLLPVLVIGVSSVVLAFI